MVWYCFLVEITTGPVVTTGPPVTGSSLGHHVKTSTGGGADNPELQHVVIFPLGSFETILYQSLGSGRDWWSGGFNVVSAVMIHRCAR